MNAEEFLRASRRAAIRAWVIAKLRKECLPDLTGEKEAIYADNLAFIQREVEDDDVYSYLAHLLLIQKEQDDQLTAYTNGVGDAAAKEVGKPQQAAPEGGAAAPQKPRRTRKR